MVGLHRFGGFGEKILALFFGHVAEHARGQCRARQVAGFLLLCLSSRICSCSPTLSLSLCDVCARVQDFKACHVHAREVLVHLLSTRWRGSCTKPQPHIRSRKAVLAKVEASQTQVEAVRGVAKAGKLVWEAADLA